MDCTLNYIPKHLHTNNRPSIDNFSEGEMLFYRCKEGECKQPYNKKNLYDLSHNRNFCDERKYKKEDVLFNVIEEDENEKYKNFKIAELRISNLNGKNTYIKKIQEDDLIAVIILKHDPIPCMYPHSVFEISLNGTTMTRENYKSLLGKKSRAYKNLKISIRQELSSMIQTGSIDLTNDVEIIDEP